MKIICPYCDKEFEESEAMPAETSNVTVKIGIGDRIDEWTEERRDNNNKLLGKRTDIYTYYISGQVDTITQKEFDGAGKLISEKDVKHPDGGGKPIVTVKEVGNKSREFL